MQNTVWTIDFSFPYPPDCTLKVFRSRVEDLAAQWRGWDHFPWRVTRNIHRFVDSPPVNFQYLLIHHCVSARSSNLVLTAEFESREDLFEMMIREQFQYIGVFRLMLIDALRYEMRFARRPYILDCTGPEEGHMNVGTEELEAARLAGGLGPARAEAR